MPHTLFASQTASHYSLEVISAIFLMCTYRSPRYLPYALKQGRRCTPNAGKTPRPAGVSGGEPVRNKQGQALRIADLHPKLTRLLNYPPPKKVIRYHRAGVLPTPHAHARIQNTLAPYSPASCIQLRGKCFKSGEK